MRFAAAMVVFFLAGNAFAYRPAESSARAGIQFKFENPQLEPQVYSLVIYEDGTGSYTVPPSSTPSGDASAQPVERAIHIQDPLRTQLFEAARTAHFFAMDCEQPHDKTAFTGKKTLAYTGPDGSGSCTFNYSHEASLNEVAAELMSIAFTLEEGAKLSSEHLHDRLSLDSELESLADAARNKRALELENIAPELESIANDDAVMQRARKRARALLSEPAGGK